MQSSNLFIVLFGAILVTASAQYQNDCQKKIAEGSPKCNKLSNSLSNARDSAKDHEVLIKDCKIIKQTAECWKTLLESASDDCKDDAMLSSVKNSMGTMEGSYAAMCGEKAVCRAKFSLAIVKCTQDSAFLKKEMEAKAEPEPEPRDGDKGKKQENKMEVKKDQCPDVKKFLKCSDDASADCEHPQVKNMTSKWQPLREAYSETCGSASIVASLLAISLAYIISIAL